MAALDWPAELPQGPITFSEQQKSIVARTATDSGPVKTRRRFTKAPRTATMSFLMTIDQYLILDAFYENDLRGGSIAVRFMHPWKQVVKEMTITAPPTFANSEGLGVNVNMQVEYF